MSSMPPYGNAPLNYAAPARNDIREIAVRQRVVMLCILGYIACVILQFVVPGPLKLVVALAGAAFSITGAVFVFMLAVAIYSTGLGVVLGILTLIPIIGLIVLLIVNAKATTILRAHGIKVGLLGADKSQIPPPNV